jgi:hypothetical protein
MILMFSHFQMKIKKARNLRTHKEIWFLLLNLVKTLLPLVPLSRFNGKQLLPLENKIIETKTDRKTSVFTPILNYTKF